ncbi:hypothetical protein EDD18DRAFT_1175228, partial [Armillaria luteobubalina]
PLAAYSSTLAPIRRLPSEILRAVFLEVQSSLWNMDWNPWHDDEYSDKAWGVSPDLETLDFSRGPWKLSHVCGAWRDVVLSYPRLWSDIALYYGTNPPALQAMILSSAQHPLDIAFNLLDKDKETVAMEAFPMILEQSC